MATIGTIRSATAHDTAYKGDRHVVLPLTAVANSDSLTAGSSGVPEGITRVAWEPDDSGDQVAVTISSGNVAFGTSGATTHAGKLHIWCKR